MKVMIISQPKAGTYLCANLLKEFGLYMSGYHFSRNNYQKYDLNDLDHSRNNPGYYTTKEKFSRSIHFIEDNYFAVGHLEYRQGWEKMFDNLNFKKIVLTRDLESCKKSWKKWAESTGRSINSDPQMNLEKREKIARWISTENTFHMEFNDMKNRNLEKIDDLQVFLFDEVKVSSKNAINGALSKDSKTKIK